MRIFKKNFGFTMIELIMVVGLLGVVTIGTGMYLSDSFKESNQLADKAEVQASVGALMNKLETTIKVADVPVFDGNPEGASEFIINYLNNDGTIKKVKFTHSDGKVTIFEKEGDSDFEEKNTYALIKSLDVKKVNNNGAEITIIGEGDKYKLTSTYYSRNTKTTASADAEDAEFKYSVVYYLDAGTMDADDKLAEKKYNIQKPSIDIPNPTKNDYNFSGWKKVDDDNEQVYKYDDSIELVEGKNTFYGTWQRKDITLASRVEIGDYIKYIPTSTSYTIPTTVSGFASDYTINPSNTTSWRVLSNDGTNVEIISSENAVGFKAMGNIGYVNYVQTLQDISASFINPTYAVGARSIGYSEEGLTEDEIANYRTIDTETYPLKLEISDAFPYIDTQYAADVSILSNYEMLTSISVLASRCTWLNSESTRALNVCGVDADGNMVASLNLCSASSYGTFNNAILSAPVRPIVTLKPDILILSGSGTEEDPYVVTEATDQYYTITYCANEGYGTMKPQIVTKESSITLNYNEYEIHGDRTFAGWSTNATATTVTYTDGQTITPTKDMTLYAVWEDEPAPSYTITYLANAPSDATVTVPDSQSGSTITIGGGATRTNGTKSTEFIGWSETEGTWNSEQTWSKPGDEITLTEDKTLYAVWKITNYYDANNGEYGDESTVKSFSQYTTYIAPYRELKSDDLPERDGYILKGWSTDSNTINPQYGHGEWFYPWCDTYFYAVWESKTESYGAIEGEDLSDAEIGAYVTYNPPQTSLDIDSLVGYDGNDSIDASQTTVWRIFRKTDGIVELISAHGAIPIILKGKTSYDNLTTILDTVAECYKNDYAENVRTFGNSDRSTLDTYPKLKVWKRIILPLTYYSSSEDYGYQVYHTSTAIYNVALYKNGEDKGTTRWFRPIVTLKTGIKVTGGDGSYNNPYTIEITCDHTWVSTSTTTNKCTVTTTYTCSNCVDTKTETTTTHTYNETVYYYEDAQNCGYTCDCGTLKHTIAHDWDDGTIQDNAKIYECNRCHGTKSDTLNTIILAYDANGGTGAPSTQTATTATTSYTFTISSTIPTRAGYTFASWNTEEDGSGTTYSSGSSINVENGTETLYAQWTLNNNGTAVLVYDANGGSGAPTSETYSLTGTTTSHAFTISSTIPTKAGYTFVNWKDGSGTTYNAGGSITVGNETVTLSAQWTLNNNGTAVLAYDANEGSGAPTSETYNLTGTTTSHTFTVTDEEPTRTGYVFVNWKDGSGTTYNAGGSITVGNETVTLYAQWEETTTITLTYTTSDGTSLTETVPDPQVGEVSTSNPTYTFKVTDEVATRTDGTKNTEFVGWSKTTGKWSTQPSDLINGGEGLSVTQDTTLHAVWKITNYYDANNGEYGDGDTVKSFAQYTTYVAPYRELKSSDLPARNGYVLKGWSTDSNTTNPQYGYGEWFYPWCDTYFYAVWEDKDATYGTVLDGVDDLVSDAEIGSYVEYKPTSESVTLTLNDDGISISSKTYYPSNATLWRVFKKNSDGTIELISADEVGTITMYGQTGYNKLASTLCKLANEYINEEYASSARPFGYTSDLTADSYTNMNETLQYQNISWGFPYKYTYYSNSDKAIIENNPILKTWARIVVPWRYVETSISAKTSSFMNQILYTSNHAYPQNLYVIKDGATSGTAYGMSSGFRPIVTLKSGITVTGGDGSRNAPYTIE